MTLGALFFLTIAMTPLAAMPAPEPASEQDANALPTAPLLLELVDFEAVLMSGGTCAKIRPVALHSDCTYSLCESRGCGAPYFFDAVDCACYCGFNF